MYISIPAFKLNSSQVPKLAIITIPLLAITALTFCFLPASLSTQQSLNLNEVDGVMTNLIIDTDLFSDVDDAAALMLACASPNVNLLAVNVNYPSSYSALAASAILNHYGHSLTPIGLRRPYNNETFFDSRLFLLGEYASKVAFHWSGGSLIWGRADLSSDPIQLYRKTLSAALNASVTVASIGFFENLSGLLDSQPDEISSLTGMELVSLKVSKLVVMGGQYPSGREYNFWGDNPIATAHVINSWPGRIVYLGDELGSRVGSGASMSTSNLGRDPVAAAFQWYVGYNTNRESWDPLAIVYAIEGLGEIFEYANIGGYNHVFSNGSNEWRYSEGLRAEQRWLKLKVSADDAGHVLDKLYLKAARQWRQDVGFSGDSYGVLDRELLIRNVPEIIE